MPKLLTADQIHQLALRAMLIDEGTHDKEFTDDLRRGVGPDADIYAYEVAVRAVWAGIEASTDHRAAYLAYIGWPMIIAIGVFVIWLAKWAPWAEWM